MAATSWSLHSDILSLPFSGPVIVPDASFQSLLLPRRFHGTSRGVGGAHTKGLGSPQGGLAGSPALPSQERGAGPATARRGEGFQPSGDGSSLAFGVPVGNSPGAAGEKRRRKLRDEEGERGARGGRDGRVPKPEPWVCSRAPVKGAARGLHCFRRAAAEKGLPRPVRATGAGQAGRAAGGDSARLWLQAGPQRASTALPARSGARRGFRPGLSRRVVAASRSRWAAKVLEAIQSALGTSTFTGGTAGTRCCVVASGSHQRGAS